MTGFDSTDSSPDAEQMLELATFISLGSQDPEKDIEADTENCFVGH